MPRKPSLNDRHTAILNFVRDYRHAHDYSPSIREIGAHINVHSTFLLEYYLDGLQDAGLIRRDPNIARSIVVVEVK